METAMALVLLVASSLLVRSYRNEISINPGFDRKNLLTLQLELPEPKHPNPEGLRTAVERAVHRFKELLGSEMVAATQKLPMAGGLFFLDTFSVQDQPLHQADQRPSASGMSVTPDYFRTLRIPLLKGRDFSDADSGTHPVAIVSETLARQYLGDTPNPIGRRIRFDHGAGS
jgi:putative ABC transport system permease protein